MMSNNDFQVPVNQLQPHNARVVSMNFQMYSYPVLPIEQTEITWCIGWSPKSEKLIHLLRCIFILFKCFNEQMSRVLFFMLTSPLIHVQSSFFLIYFDKAHVENIHIENSQASFCSVTKTNKKSHFQRPMDTEIFSACHWKVWLDTGKLI